MGKDMLQLLSKEVISDYSFLKRISPKNELLKYFVMEGRTFRNDHSLEVSKEFSKRFWGDFPTLEQAKEEEEELDIKEYCSNLFMNLLVNYGLSLQEEIRLSLMKN